MIDGANELDKAFARAQEIGMAEALRASAEFVMEQAKDLCPAHDGNLRDSIKTEIAGNTASIYTDSPYAAYVEYGTGPKGAANHEGTSPDANIHYSQSPWWIHEGSGENEVSRSVGENYQWEYVDTKQGRFYRCTGQAASPYMYPALRNNEEKVVKIFKECIDKEMGK